jgi:hypothetical protein
MYKARKANRVVRIPDEKVDEYKQLGYTITTPGGTMIYQPEDKDTTIRNLQTEVQQLRQRVAELEAAAAAAKENTMIGAETETKPESKRSKKE